MLVTVAAYAPVRHHEFVSYDDHVYVTANAHVKQGLTPASVAWALTTADANFWHPLTWLSLLLDVQLFGVNAGPMHVTNLVLHLLSTLLLFYALKRMTGATGPSAFVAALFAVHPLHVESVAWIAERKDTLSTVFWMLTLCAYAAYARRPGWTRYLLVLASFSLGLMAKPMLVTLPFVLLLLDVWPLRRLSLAGDDRDGGRLRRALPLVREKVPLIVLAGAASVMAVVAQQRGGAVGASGIYPPGVRLANALVAYADYIVKTVWPSGLVGFYPYPPAPPVGAALAAAAALAAVTGLVLWQVQRRPYLAVGWCWYIGTLVPVSGLVQVGSHAMADRYTYVPLVGLFIMVAWGAREVLPRWPFRGVAMAAIAGLVLAACVVTTRQQVMTWRDSVSLWRHMLAVIPDNFFAHLGLGKILEDRGERDEALTHLREAVRLAPQFAETHHALGLALARRGRPQDALACYAEARRLRPRDALVQASYGTALEQIGRFDEAVAALQTAVAWAPGTASFHDDLGHALARAGRTPEATTQFGEALRLDPDYAPAHDNMGTALLAQGRTEEALAQYLDAVRLGPRYAPARENLGRALLTLGRTTEAIASLSEAARLAPGSTDVHALLAVALAAAGRNEDAIEQYREAARLGPDRADVQSNFGILLASQGRAADAVPYLAAAVRLQPESDAAHVYLGMALAAAGRYDEGEGQLVEALRLNPANRGARQALEHLPRRARSGR